MMFRILLIVAAAIALLAIIIHYNNSVCSSPSPEPYSKSGYEYFQAYQEPTAPGESGLSGVSGTAEDVFSVPAPVQPREAQGQIPETRPPGETPQKKEAQRYPADALQPKDLLPVVGNTPEEQQFAQLYSTGQGDMQGINFLDAGSQIGLSTRLNRNPNLQLRSDPHIAKQPLPFLFSTIESDKLRKPLEIGSNSSAVPAPY